MKKLFIGMCCLTILIGCSSQLPKTRNLASNVGSYLSIWPNATVYYSFKDYPVHCHKTASQAMALWSKGTPVKFVERTTQSAYAAFVIFDEEGKDGQSSVGFQGGRQQIEIGIKSCEDISTLLHEIGHVLGLEHEHQRPDRDKYVVMDSFSFPRDIYKSNVDPYEGNPVGPFDLDSVMLYQDHFVKGSDTRRAKVVQPSDGDYLGILYLYGTKEDYLAQLEKVNSKEKDPRILMQILEIL